MVTRLTEGVWWLDLGGVNAYLVDDGGDLTLVDAGMPWHARHVAGAVGTVGDGLGSVERVLVTHYDLDHVGSLGRLDALEAPVYVGRADADYVAGRDRPPWASRKGAFQRATGWWVRSPNGPVEPVDDGDEIGGFRAIHTPGHTPGHTVYVHDDRSVALLGDVVRESNGHLEPSPWFLSDDVREVKQSVRDLADRLGDFDVAAMGHGTPFAKRGSEHLANCAEGIRTPRA
ncbi:MBL fold metallo-hydrolase [Halobacteriales archaeon Cl-PHB]